MAYKVALAGATGNLGPAILKALLDAGFEVTILTRQGSSSTDSIPSHPNQQIAKVDYGDNSSLTKALTGVNTVVSNLAAGNLEAQNSLVDAAVAAGVKRFIPSEFGSDLEQPTNVDLPVFKGKIEARKHIEEVAKKNPEFTYTFVVNNAFFDWGLQAGFVANPKGHKATLYDGGDVKFSVTRLSTVGLAVAAIIRHQEATKNRQVKIHDTALSQKDIIAITKEIDGEEWTTEVKDTEEATKEAYAELQKPEPNVGKALVGFLFGAAFGHGRHTDYSDTVDNEVLGLEFLDREGVKAVIKAAL